MLQAAWQKLLTNRRMGLMPNTGKTLDTQVNTTRTHFQKDYDRVIFSPAFRRLARKTQVHPLAENDHVHTRLTHSLEVACVGRSLGAMAGEALEEKGLLPKQVTPLDVGVIVQSACLAHDIGNPPFGHTGEDAVRDWFCHPDRWEYLQHLPHEAQVQDFQLYEGNAQGLRLVTRLEKHLNSGGLRLTYPTLGALIKYPWLSHERSGRSKFGCFYSEASLLAEIAEVLGLEQSNTGGYKRHPLVYLVEAADDVCYRVLDLEDAVELGILSYSRYEKMVGGLVSADRLREAASARSNKAKLTLLRGPLIEKLVAQGAQGFIDDIELLTLGEEATSLFDRNRHSPEAQFLEEAQAVAETIIFKNKPKTEIEVGVYATLGNLLSVFIGAAFQWHADEGQFVSRRTQCINELLGSHGFVEGETLYDSYMKVMDFLSGMTDQHATNLSRRLSGILQ